MKSLIQHETVSVIGGEYPSGHLQNIRKQLRREHDSGEHDGGKEEKLGRHGELCLGFYSQSQDTSDP